MANSLTALERGYQGFSTFLDVFLGQDQRAALHFRDFVEKFQELEDEFAAALPTVLPLLQRHTQLMMIRYFNDATIHGALAPLPRIMDLVDIIQFKQWTQLIPIPSRYFVAPPPFPQPLPRLFPPTLSPLPPFPLPSPRPFPPRPRPPLRLHVIPRPMSSDRHGGRW
jgi:hypothetical protein